MENTLTESSINRLALGIIEKYNCTYSEAIERLESLSLNLICGKKVARYLPLQAALITTINTAKRAFLGNVAVKLPENIPCLIPGYGGKTLNDLVVELGAIISTKSIEDAVTLTFGEKALDNDSCMEIICNSWQGGAINFDSSIQLEEDGFLPLGGIAAGAIAVSSAFNKASGIDITSMDEGKGISLWRPDLLWYSPDAKGPIIKVLPQKYWMLGLGHLGQGYLWNIGMLPYKTPSEVTCLLQDFDRISEGNWSTGLLCNEEQIKSERHKTRICSDWLELRGIKTTITERSFDIDTKPNIKNNEPLVALCGFDSAPPRSILEKVGFEVIIEAGLGKNLSGFDEIRIHTFPSSTKSASDLWSVNIEEEINQAVYDKFIDPDAECGNVATTIAKKAISASFVGALTGALVIAETIRGYNSGTRYDKIAFRLRNLKAIYVDIHPSKNWRSEFASNGYVSV